MYCFSKMCRLCLNRNCSLFNYEDCDMDNISSCDKLKKIIPEFVNETIYNFPPWICPVCNEDLNNTYKFYKKCLKSYYLLKSYSEKLQSVPTDSLRIKTNIVQEEFNTNEKNSPIKQESVIEEDFKLFEELLKPYNSNTFKDDFNLFQDSCSNKSSNLVISIKEESSEVIQSTPVITVKEESSEVIQSPVITIKEELPEVIPSIKEEEASNVVQAEEFSNVVQEEESVVQEAESVVQEEENSVKEESSNFNLFDEDTLLGDENSNGSNANNEIHPEIAEKSHFSLFTNKTDTSIKEKINENKGEEELEDLIFRRRRCTRQICYEESDNEPSLNNDSDFQPENSTDKIINSNEIHPKIAEKSHFNLFANKTDTINVNINETKRKEELDDLIIRRRRCTKPICYEESDDEPSNLNKTVTNIVNHNLSFNPIVPPTNYYEQSIKNLESRKPAIVIHHLPNPSPQTESIASNQNLELVTTSTKPPEKIKSFRRKFVCNICRNKFKSSEELRNHILSHEIQQFKCKICDKICTNSNELELHKIEHYQIIENDKHVIINLTRDSNKSDSIINLTRDSDSDSFDVDGDYYMELNFCSICNKKYKNFTEHMKIHQKENKPACVYCGVTFPIKNQLFLHLRDAHCSNEPICQICNETFKNVDLLFLHMYSHYGTEVHKCPKCDQLFLYINLMYRHLDVDHKCAEFSCTKCDKTFTSYKFMMHHVFHHDSKVSTLCHICGKGFKSKGRLRVHQANWHAPSEEYNCSSCGKRFNNKQKLGEHIQLKHDPTRYICDVCAKDLPSKRSLNIHRNKHFEEKKKYGCETCGKKFQLKFMLINHERIHTGEKPFECKTCGKKFRQEISLTVHDRTHTGDKPYRCKDCGKSYTQSYVYKMHVKKHHSGENKTKKCDDEGSKDIEKCGEENNKQSLKN